MENTNTDKSLFDINFDENVKQNLKAAATWGGIAALVSLAGSLLGLVNYFIQKQKMTGYSETQQTAVAVSGFISVAISFIIGIILFVFLNKFSRKTKSGLEAGDQHLVNEGLGSLSVYFKFIGVLLIIAIVIFGLALAVGIGNNV